MNSTARIFGSHIDFSNSFSWVSWKAKSECQWVFLSANINGIGANLQYEKISPMISDEASFEDYNRLFMQDLAERIEISTLHYPFSFGLPRGVRAAILTKLSTNIE